MTRKQISDELSSILDCEYVYLGPDMDDADAEWEIRELAAEFIMEGDTRPLDEPPYGPSLAITLGIGGFVLIGYFVLVWLGVE